MSKEFTDPSAEPAAQEAPASLAVPADRTERAVAERRASKAAGDIHAAGLAEDIAARVKDASALEAAVLRKLEAQREFAAQYQGLFPWGVNVAYRGVDRTVHSSEQPKRAEWCLSFGFHERTVRRWCDLIDGAKYAAKQAAVVKKCWELAELWQSASFSSESCEWYTPTQYIEAARQALGTIDLDPASSVTANATVKAGKFFTIEDDGLQQRWFGCIFVNPPYGKTEDGRSLASAFCNKAISEYNAGNIEAGIILVNSLHSQSWQAPLYDHFICFVNHRIHFISDDGEENENPTFQNIFIYLGAKPARFIEAFSRFGYVMRRAKPHDAAVPGAAP